MERWLSGEECTLFLNKTEASIPSLTAEGLLLPTTLSPDGGTCCPLLATVSITCM